MLIDTRDRDEPDDEPPHEPLGVDWALCGWIAATLVLFLAAGWVPPLIGLVLALAGLWTTFRILMHVTGGWGSGIGDWRQ